MRPPKNDCEGFCRGEIYTLSVANDWQGQGIGDRLLSGLFEALRSTGAKDALIWVLSRPV